MPSIPLVALKGFAYHRKRLTKGDAFEALTASDAKVLRLAGMARDADTNPGASLDLDAPILPTGVESIEYDASGTPTIRTIPSPKRPRGRPKKYETAALTPDDK